MAQLIRAKKLSAREALAEHLKQIDRVNPKVNAIVTLVAEMASEAARRADEMQARGEKLGPLHGLPVAHKDLIETRGIRTTFGSPLFKDNARIFPAPSPAKTRLPSTAGEEAMVHRASNCHFSQTSGYFELTEKSGRGQ